MGRYWRIYRTFFVSSLQRELEFRANLFAKVAQNVVWMAFFVLIILVVYLNTDSVAGWSRGDAYILAATCFIMNAFVSAFFMSLMEIPEQVRRGTLDFVITKPVDTQFWISLRRFNFDQIGSLVAGIGMLVLGIVTADLQPTALQLLAYWVLTVCSTIIFYAFSLCLMTLGIWLVRVDNLWVLGETIMQVARYPLDIYNVPLRQVLTYILPLAFIATVPASQLAKGFDPGMLLLGVAWATISFLAARWFWNFALKHYTSASS